jgi:phosphoenolpyruvate-protein kinase (PTS system EI component)
MCGEMAGEPLFAPLLLGMGIDELSASASSLPRVKEMIRRLTHREAQELAAASLHANSGREVLAMLNSILQRVDPDLLG